MKLLINLCAHDGIVSHYTGVGTMVKRYIKTFIKLLDQQQINYEINLFTPVYNKDSFGYSNTTHNIHSHLKNTKIYQVSNGSDGKINYGTPDYWETLCQNTSKLINEINYDNYDLVLTLANDTPFAGLLLLLDNHKNHKTMWIPHSTVKIHLIDSAVENSENLYQTRLEWEQNTINYINNNDNSYLVGIGEFIKKHLIEEYHLNKNKILTLTNGEILDEQTMPILKGDYNSLFNKIKEYDNILLSFSRAEEYKNLEGTMLLGASLNIPTIVIAQSYYKEQPILKKYQELSNITNTNLFIDPPFNFAKYILHNYNKPIILLVPSKKEIMGLIINEIRHLNKDNILIVANNINGLKEQITDNYDGLIVNLDNIEESKNKIISSFNQENMFYMNKNSQNTLKEKYDFTKNCHSFLKEIIGDNYE